MSQVDLALEALQRARSEAAQRLAAIDDAIAAVTRVDAPPLLALPAPDKSAPVTRAKAKRAIASNQKKTANPRKPRSPRVPTDPAIDVKIRDLHRAGKLNASEIMRAVGIAPNRSTGIFRRLGLPPLDKSKTVQPKPRSIAKPPPASVASSAPPPTDEAAEIARFLETKGVTREIDWGGHKEIVEAGRAALMQIFRAKAPHVGGRAWLVNGQSVNTTTLYERVNTELRRRNLPEIAMPKETA